MLACIMASKRRHNQFFSIVVEGNQVEGVTNVFGAVFSHFAAHFIASNVVRPDVDDLQLRTLTSLDGGQLVKPLSLEEAKTVV